VVAHHTLDPTPLPIFAPFIDSLAVALDKSRARHSVPRPQQGSAPKTLSGYHRGGVERGNRSADPQSIASARLRPAARRPGIGTVRIPRAKAE